MTRPASPSTAPPLPRDAHRRRAADQHHGDHRRRGGDRVAPFQRLPRRASARTRSRCPGHRRCLELRYRAAIADHQLRGLVGVEIELKALRAPLHSGMWGGTVPDAVQALCRLIASLSDEHGEIAIPGISAACASSRPWSDPPMPGCPMTPGASPTRRASSPAAARRWRRGLPAHVALAVLSVNAIQRGARQTGNVVMDSAWARLGIRIVRTWTARPSSPSWSGIFAPMSRGMRLDIVPLAPAPPGAAPPITRCSPPAAAMARGYGVQPVFIGCGGSIPFVGEMTAKLAASRRS